MKTELAPVDFGAHMLTQDTLLVVGAVIAITIALIVGARRETAFFAVFAGVVGYIATLQ